MIRYKTSPGARILFVGINPHHGSYRRGVPFSNNKTFWYLLNRAGILNEDESDLRQDHLLKSMYDRKFLSKYRLNFINLVDRPTTNVAELKRGEEEKGVRRALKIIRACKPRVVCFIGKVTFSKFSGSQQCCYGWQPDIFYSKAYVMHFPIRGPASIRIKELKEIQQTSEAASGRKATARQEN